MWFNTTILFIIFGLVQIKAGVYAQRITIAPQHMSIERALGEINEQTGYHYLWSPKNIQIDRKVIVDLSNATLETAMAQLLSSLPLSYELQGKTIVIREKTVLENIKDAILPDRSRPVGKPAEGAQQTITSTGRVVDEQGRPLSGASIIRKSTSKGISAKVDGSFSISNVTPGEILIIKYLGYDAKEVPAAEQIGIIRLVPTENPLDEIQITAYGKTSRRLSTSNISSVTAEEIERQPVQNPLLSLQGRIPGLQITQATGTPGSTLTIRIQGTNSLRGSNEPFYVVDGVPFNSSNVRLTYFTSSADLLFGASSTKSPLVGGGLRSSAANSLDPGGNGNPFNYLNAADIERIEVLKDADATAIYGSRAANGAILITTKKGKIGKLKVDLDLSSGQNKVTRRVDLMNTAEYLEMRREAKNNSQAAILSTDYDLNGTYDTTRYTDWQELVFGNTSGYHKANLALSGGSNNTTFRINLGYNRQNSLYPTRNFNDQGLSGNMSLDTRSNNQKFRMSFTAGYFSDNNKLPNVDLTSTLLYLPPNSPNLFNPDGTLNLAENSAGSGTWTGGNDGNNPLLSLLNKYNTTTGSLTTNAHLSYNLVKGLDISTTLGYNKSDATQYYNETLASYSSYLKQYLKPYANFGNTKSSNYIVEPQVTYNLEFGRNKLSFLAGGSVQQKKSDGQSIYAGNYLNDAQLGNLAFGQYFSTDQTSSIYKYSGFFGNANYNYDNKFLVNFTARRDGSSRFGADNRFHTFGAIGLGYVFSEEEWLKNQLPVLSFGKIKASYGTTGNDGIGDYTYMDLHQRYDAEINYQTIGFYANQLVNKKLQWELTKKLNLGVDLGFYSDRLYIGVNYAMNRSSNLVQTLQLSAETGIGSIAYNFPGTIQNTSLEFSISSQNIKGKFSWSTNLNFTIPRNKLVSFDNSGLFGGLAEDKSKSYIVGQPLGSLWTYHFLGVDPQSGVYMVEDQYGNPTSVASRADNYADAKVLINPNSPFYGGMGNSFSYKGFTLDVMFQYVKQIKQRYALASGLGGPGARPFNQPRELLERWQFPGDISSIQKFATSGVDSYIFTQTDAAWENADYLRLKNVAISYSVPSLIANKVGVQSCSVSVMCQNLLTVTKYSGLDPESGSSITPPYQTIVIGLKIGI